MLEELWFCSCADAGWWGTQHEQHSTWACLWEMYCHRFKQRWQFSFVVTRELIFPSSPWAMDPPAVFNQEWPLLRDHLLGLMLKPLSRTVVVTGIRSSSSMTWIFFPGSPSPGCSAWWQVCNHSERRGLESGDVPDLTAGRGAGVFSSIWYAPALSTEWNTCDQNSKKTSTSISSRDTKIRFVQLYVMTFTSSHDKSHLQWF